MHNTQISRKLNNWINFLHHNKKITLVLIFIYSFSIVLLHDPLVNVSVFVMKRMSIQGYNTFISSISLFSLLTFIVIFIVQIKKHQDSIKMKISLLIFIISFLLIHYVYLLEMNIEIIHAFAYGGLIFLFFSFFKRWAAAVIFSIPVMLIDEWNQYINLYPTYVEYWELNDVVLNTLGEIFVLFFLFSMNVKPEKSNQLWFKKPEFIFASSLIILFVVLSFTKVFVLHQNQTVGYTQFVMSRLQNHQLSWHVHGLTKKVYYILNPKEALVIVIFLCTILFSLDFALSKK